MLKYRLFIPIMKSSSQDGFEISATSNSLYSYRAFDGIKNGTITNGYYRSSIYPSLPEYLTITFPEPKLIGRYTVYLGYYSTRYNNMQTWDFEGLVNGEWMLLHSGENPVQESATLTFDFTPTEVEGVRIKCKTRYGNNSWGLDELEVFECVIYDKILLLSKKNNVLIKPVQKGYDSDINMIPKMTSNTAPSGVARASGQINIESGAWRAFDHSISTYGWLTSETNRKAWLSYEFVNPVVISKYVIYPYSATRNTPKTWTFEGSMDGVDWTVLDEQSDVTDWVMGTGKEFRFLNNNEYKHYRINIQDIIGGTQAGIQELEMYSHVIDALVELPFQTEQDFINHGMLPQDLSKVDFSSDFTEKHYIQNKSTLLGEGKVFEQPLDTGKIIKSVKIT